MKKTMTKTKIDITKLPIALVASDICVFGIFENRLCVYVIDAATEFYAGKKCLPGALIQLDEMADDTIKRVIKEKTNLQYKNIFTEQLYTFSKIDRDRRSRVVSVSYIGLYAGEKLAGFVALDTISFKSFFAYDHAEIAQVALDRLRGKLEYTSIIQKLIPKTFTFSDLQKSYEVVLGYELDKRNFRKKIESLELIEETGEYKKEGRMRPAKIYTFKSSDVTSINLFKL
jgi:8-oxo-dGTP diphosphatase